LQELPCWCEQESGTVDQLRVFTNKSGTKIKAKVAAVSGDKVKLIRDDNKKFIVLIDSLSEEDQDYLRAWVADGTVEQK
jgi:hypothetical protein